MNERILLAKMAYARGISTKYGRYSPMTGRLVEDWDEEQQKRLHPRDESGKWTKVKVSTKKFGESWYAMADQPSGSQITRSHQHEHEARRLAHEDIRSSGFEPEEELKPIPIKLENFGGDRWYAMADLPDGSTVDRSAETREKAHALAAEAVRNAGHEPEAMIRETEPPIAETNLTMNETGGLAEPPREQIPEAPAWMKEI